MERAVKTQHLAVFLYSSYYLLAACCGTDLNVACVLSISVFVCFICRSWRLTRSTFVVLLDRVSPRPWIMPLPADRAATPQHRTSVQYSIYTAQCISVTKTHALHKPAKIPAISGWISMFWSTGSRFLAAFVVHPSLCWNLSRVFL